MRNKQIDKQSNIFLSRILYISVRILCDLYLSSPMQQKQQDIIIIDMDDQIQLQKQALQNTGSPQPLQTSQTTTNITSNHTQQYLEFFQPSASTVSIDQILNNLNTKQITYNHEQFHPQLQARIFKHDKNYNIAVFEISYGHFQIEISTIRTQSKSCLHSPALKSIGSKQSTIYFLKHHTNNNVAKCISIDQKKKKIEVLAQVIRQYSLLKIASLLGIAPALCTQFGFDLFIYEDCIEFFSSQCMDIKSCASKIYQEQIQNLKMKLRTLHTFKIIHLDIKTDNILFCPEKNELVFIDFGFSKVIEEDIGFKTMTSFAGTMSYCSPQMTAISGHSSSFIDLYYNDLYGLQSSLNELVSYKNDRFDKYQAIYPKCKNRKRMNELYNSLINQQKYRSIMNRLMMFKLKYQIFTKNQRILKTKQLQQLILSNIPEILQYIAQHTLTKTTQQIYEFIVSNSNSPSSYLQSFLNIQEVKQQQINQLGKHATQNYKMFLQVYGLKDSEAMEYRLGENIPIVLILKDRRCSTRLFGQNIQRGKSSSKIMADFCQLVDFLKCNTSLTQKIQLSQQFIQYFHIDHTDFKLNSQYPSLQLCLKYMLNKIIASLDVSFEDTIPQIITNLVIIQALQTEQLVSAIKQILAINCCELKYLKLLFQLRTMIVWNIYRVQFSIKHECITINAYEMIYNRLLDVAMKNNNKQIRFIVMLILLDQRRQLPQPQIQTIAHQIDYLDTGDVPFNNLLKTHFFIWRMQNQQQSIYFYQFLRIIYEINEIDPSLIFHPQHINHFHIELFQLFETSAENYILANIYGKLQRCFEGTGILKKYRLYYTYRPQTIKNNVIGTKLEQLQNTEPIKLTNLSYQVLFEYNQILIQIKSIQQQQTKTDLLMRVATIFDDFFLEQIVLPDQNQHKIKQFYVSNVLITKLYLQLYPPQSPLSLSILKHIARLQQYQQTISCENCSLKSDFLLLEIKWRVSRHLGNYQQAIYYLIKHIQLTTQGNTIQNQDLKFIFYDVRKIIEFITEQKIYTLQELKSSRNIQFVCRTIKEYKLHIYGLSHAQGLNVFSFQCWYTLVINSQLEQFFTLNNQILSLIHQYPDKHYVDKYESYFQMFIKEFDSWWKHTATTVLTYLIINIKTIASNSLICLFLALFLRFCHPRDELFPIMKYYICRDIDSIDKRARYITLTHFLTHFLIQNGTMPNRRQRRFKVRKFASYIRSDYFQYQQFERKMGVVRRVKQQRCVFTKMMRLNLSRFHLNFTTK